MCYPVSGRPVKRVHRMEQYVFSTLAAGDGQPYIFQTTAGRRCSPVLHTHDFYEFVLMLQGETAQLVNGEEMLLREGEGILLCPGASHRFLRQSERANVLALSVERTEFSRFAIAFGLIGAEEGAAQPFSAQGERAALGRRVQGCVDALPAERLLACRALLALCLVCLAQQSGAAEHSTQTAKWLRECAKPDHLREGMPALLRLSGYSQAQLTRIVRRECGKTPHQLLFSLRMDYAYRLLAQTGMSTEKVCEACGFSSLSHFCKAFTATFSLSPAALRRQYRTV